MSVVQELDLTNNIINFIGLEGSGKSKLAGRLSLETGLPIFPTGDRLRYYQAHDHTELGDACRAMFEQDGYLDGITMLGILRQGLQEAKYSRGLIMDGGLRTVEETAGYRAMLQEAGRDFRVIVVKLNIPEQLGIDRLLNDPRPGRKPDTPESIAKRHSYYKYRVDERVALIKSMTNCALIEVDATHSLDQNYHFICTALMNLFAGDLV